MRFPTMAWRAPGPSLCFFIALAGCARGHNALHKEREIDQLRFENARRRESIIESLAESERLKREISDLTAERENLAKQIGEISTTLRAANEKLAATTAQRDEFKTRLAEAEKSADRLRESVDKVRSIASASAGELADLRLKKQELEEQVRRLLQSQASLGDENRSLSSQANDLKEDLVRTRAVLRSLREGNGDHTEINALEDQVRDLQKKSADLQGEKVALEKRIEALGGAGGAASAGAVATGGETSHQDPQRLVAEVTSLIRERYENAVQGKFAWDHVDFALLGTMAMLLLGFVWAGMRWVRNRRLVKKVRLLTSRVRELEHDASARGPEPAEGAPANTVQRPERTRTPSVRRSGFSAVIPKKEIAEAASPPRDADDQPLEAAALEEESVPVLAGAVPSPKGRSGPEPRRAAGRQAWNEDASGAGKAADAFAHTQIITRPAAEAKGGSSTSPAAKPTKKGEESKDDIELLAELKSVINKKFDELMK